jgi:hypothetical protein
MIPWHNNEALNEKKKNRKKIKIHPSTKLQRVLISKVAGVQPSREPESQEPRSTSRVAKVCMNFFMGLEAYVTRMEESEPSSPVKGL